jgi:hypothetical protein
LKSFEFTEKLLPKVFAFGDGGVAWDGFGARATKGGHVVAARPKVEDVGEVAVATGDPGFV